MGKKILLSIGLSACISILGFAIPANPTPRTITQPDGTTVTIRLHGDEYGSFVTTAEGHHVTLCADGYYRYSTLSDDNTITTCDRVARDSDASDISFRQFIESTKQSEITSKLQIARDSNRSRYSFSARPQGAPLRRIAQKAATEGKEVRGLVIMVQFQDVKFSENGTIENFDALMNEPNNDYLGAIGSARDYFIDQSYGKFCPKFDIIGPVTVSQNEAYYGEAVTGANDVQPHKMVIEACQIAHSEGLCNLADYDSDGDGVVDLVFVIFAGYAQSSGAPSWTIWPHASWIGSIAKEEYNGVTLDAYACASELAGTSGTDLYGIGAICHEYSHTLGLPDLYDTTFKGGFGMNKWSVMDQGCYNADSRVPAGYSSYERAFCGWLELNELTEATSVTLPDLGQYGIAYKVASGNPDRYFTIENRTLSKWDKYLPTEGMMIVKIDYDQTAWQSNTVNTISGRQRVQFVAADNLYTTSSLEGDLWPWNGHNEFSDKSTPAMKIHLTTIRNKALTNIAFDSQSGLVTFDFMGGTPTGMLSAPLALTAEINSDSTFTARWTPVSGATSYTLYIEEASGAIEPIVIENIASTEYQIPSLSIGTYLYKVKAVNSTTESPYSNTIQTTLSSGIKNVTTDKGHAYFDGSAIIVKNSTARHAYIYNTQGILIKTIKIQNGTGSFCPQNEGLYFVRVGKSSTKIIVR